jgi:hypothetical protein
MSVVGNAFNETPPACSRGAHIYRRPFTTQRHGAAAGVGIRSCRMAGAGGTWFCDGVRISTVRRLGRGVLTSGFVRRGIDDWRHAAGHDPVVRFLMLRHALRRWTLWSSYIGFGYGTCGYSLIGPPWIGRRWTRAVARSTTCVGGLGGRCCGDRCGRCVLWCVVYWSRTATRCRSPVMRIRSVHSRRRVS